MSTIPNKLPSRAVLIALLLAATMVVLQVTATMAVVATGTYAVEVPSDEGDEPPPPPLLSTLYISTSKSGRINDIYFHDEDILSYDLATGAWALVFDGSDVGVAKANLDAFHLLEDGSILMNFNKRMRIDINGQRTLIDDSDIVRFIPTGLGPDTSGSFEQYFTGAPAGLDTGSEDIDALSLDRDGNLVISTIGTFENATMTLGDEDLITISDTLSPTLLFDGSDIDLSAGSEDINALAITDDWIIFSTKGPFRTQGSNVTLEGRQQALILCQLITSGEETQCLLSYFFDAQFVGFRYAIDGLSLGSNPSDGPGDGPGDGPPTDGPPIDGPGDGTPPPLPGVQSSGLEEHQQFELVPEVNNTTEDATDADAELDNYDDESALFDYAQNEGALIFIPIVTHGK